MMRYHKRVCETNKLKLPPFYKNYINIMYKNLVSIIILSAKF